MKLEIWLDYLSPLCYKQHKTIEKILLDYEFKNLELLYRSYEMIPFFSPEDDCTFHRILSKHHVISLNEAQKITEDVNPNLRPVQVIDAHRLSHLAKKEDCSFLFNLNVFKAYYEDHKDISDHQVLLDIAFQSGIDKTLTEEVLNSDMYLSQVQSNRENAIVKGIFELPHIRIDGKYRLNGYHNEKALLDELIRASAQFSKTEHCEGENCQRKKAH
ncbi:MAG: DsbA family protein [Acholeplasmataceae bacterium]|nr:DsbA family protein [Acholeplasmataceae bacterium]